MASENNVFAVIGMGNYGRAIAQTLVARGCQVRVYDIDAKKIDAIKDEVALAVALDCGDKNALQEQGIAFCTTVVIAIGADFEATMLACVNLKELNEKLRIIVRASSRQQRLVLQKLGITEILSPEQEVANAIAEKLINPNIVNALSLPDDYEIAEVKVPVSLVNKAVAEIDFAKYKLNLITIKQPTQEHISDEMHITGVPVGEMLLHEKSTLLLFGTKKNIEKFLALKG